MEGWDLTAMTCDMDQQPISMSPGTIGSRRHILNVFAPGISMYTEKEGFKCDTELEVA